jgi:heterodisulfide reductase subunit A-like polyferredoxin
MNNSNSKGSISRRDVVVAGSLGISVLTFSAVAAGAANATGQTPGRWDLEADVVVIGTGALGLPAAIIAKEAGSSVIMVEAEKHAGGHAMVSGGTIPLGGGTSEGNCPKTPRNGNGTFSTVIEMLKLLG